MRVITKCNIIKIDIINTWTLKQMAIFTKVFKSFMENTCFE